MLSIWARMSDEAKCNDLSRDFNHLAQAMASSSDTVQYELAIIFNKSFNNESYKKIAIENIVALANDDERLKKDLESFSSCRSSEYSNIQHVAEIIVQKININPNSKNTLK